MLNYRINAGYIPADHWVNDPEQGGGRILGEVCHFVDLLSFLAGALPIEVQTRNVANPGQYSGENVAISLTFANGSQGTITYIASGDKSYSKERIEDIRRRDCRGSGRFPPPGIVARWTKAGIQVALASGQRPSRRMGSFCRRAA